MVINDFHKEGYEFLSNFYPCNIELRHPLGTIVKFKHLEGAYQASKSIRLDDWLNIANQPTPGKAKRAGRNVTMRPDWNKIKIIVMKELLMKKFSIPALKSKLIATDDAYLIEGNLWHDNYWGTCRCGNCSGGQNHLGILLMEVRKEVDND